MTAPDVTPEALRKVRNDLNDCARSQDGASPSRCIQVAYSLDAAAAQIESLQQQLALARPIAEACVRWIETGGLCACCNAGPYDGHAAGCSVPAWIAGR